MRREFMEKGGGESVTRPNESYSIQDLLMKATGGIFPPVVASMEYQGGDDVTHEDLDMSSIYRMDAVEQDEIREDLSATIADRKAALEQLQKEAAVDQVARPVNGKADAEERPEAKPVPAKIPVAGNASN